MVVYTDIHSALVLLDWIVDLRRALIEKALRFRLEHDGPHAGVQRRSDHHRQ